VTAREAGFAWVIREELPIHGGQITLLELAQRRAAAPGT
jgi:hypothetical protein